MNEKILFLIGSPKPEGESACASIATRFIKFLRTKQFEIEKLNIAQSIKTEEGKNRLLGAVNSSNNIILISPVYLDTAPTSVIKLMEFLSEKKHLINGSKKMVVVSVCGFPEALHNNAVLRVYKNFADHMGFRWIGGLAIGEGFCYVYARQIFSLIGMYRRLDKSISLTIQALAEEKTIPKEAVDLMKISLIPNQLYTKIAILSAKILAIKDGAWNLYKRPYI